MSEVGYCFMRSRSISVCMYQFIFLFHLSEHFGVLNLFYITRDNHEYW